MYLENDIDRCRVTTYADQLNEFFLIKFLELQLLSACQEIMGVNLAMKKLANKSRYRCAGHQKE